MVSFSCRMATATDIRQTGAWQSPAPVFCDFTGGSYLSQLLADSHDTPCAMIHYCNEAAIDPQSIRVKPTPDSLFFQVRFAPDFCTSLRQRAISFSIQWLKRRFHPKRFTTCVDAGEDHLLNIYKRLDFLYLFQIDCFKFLELDDRPFLDASMPLQEGMPQYEGDPLFKRELLSKKENGGYNVSAVSMCVHTGTHIDTPAHVGITGAEPIDLSLLHGTVQIIDWSQPDCDAILSNRILLAHARRGLTQKEAEFFIRSDVLLLGIDRLSVGIPEEEWIVHQSLLQNGTIILENADLRGFSAGWYQMRCLPLSIPGSDGLPVRLLLREALP